MTNFPIVVLFAMMLVESDMRPSAVGDGGRAIGVLQIHAAYAKDAGFKHKDMRSVKHSQLCFISYVRRFAGGPGAKARMRVRGLVTVRHILCLHNSGPRALRNEATEAYIEKVERKVQELLRCDAAWARHIINTPLEISSDDQTKDSFTDLQNMVTACEGITLGKLKK